MLFYHKSGMFPAKRHTQFRKKDGSLYYEQLFGTEGFSGISSLLYHIHRPTRIKQIGAAIDVRPEIAESTNIHPRKFLGWKIAPESDFLESRKILMTNNHLSVGLASPGKGSQEYFYKNADCDELLFIHQGNGILHSLMGDLHFKSGDYVIIPRGIIYQINFETEENKILFTESKHPIEFPKRYRNQYGQLLENAPFCERDIVTPDYREPIDKEGSFLIKVKKQGFLHLITYANHPFDVVGWDGYNYPIGFSIHNFEPITGRIHQPPPVHQTFQSQNFVVCSFCPRLYDYHPEGIPAPYNHSNIDSDEVIYYVDGDFMSRNDIEPGVITLHPGGIPHGPQPGATERSIGKKETDELAVMIDPFSPFQLTREAMKIDDGKYFQSWL